MGWRYGAQMVAANMQVTYVTMFSNYGPIMYRTEFTETNYFQFSDIYRAMEGNFG
jgi:hypothetical protein